jgi:acetyl esterase/lipase
MTARPLLLLALALLGACGVGQGAALDDVQDTAGAPLSFLDASDDPRSAGATCVGVTCSGHGTCVTTSGAASCHCQEGYWPAGTACEPALLTTCALPPTPRAADVNLWTDVVYAQPYGQPLGLDVAFPKVGNAHALVLVVHGGGWAGGDKFTHRDDVLRLAGQGYVAASLNYRLVNGWQNKFPAAISDARCAVRWLKHNAGRFGGDPTRVFVLGASAGGELVSLLATSSGEGRLDDGTCALRESPDVTTAVSYYGRMELGRAPIPSYLVDYIGRDGDWMLREGLASPARNVGAATSPMLLLHGQRDGTVPIEQSRLMRDALVTAQVPVGLFELPDQGHDFPLFGSTGTQPMASCTTLKFLGHFAPRAQLSHPVRTVVYVEKPTAPGEQVFLRGGHDLALVQAGAYLGSAEPVRFTNRANPDSFLTKTNDTTLDWYSDSALDWTCAQWPASFGPVRRYATDGFGEDAENAWGAHFWKFDVVMDGQPGDWFEFKTFVRSGGVTQWEADVRQPGAPYVTANHWARKGFVTMVRFGGNDAVLRALP